MNEDEFLPYAMNSYNQEYQRHQNLDSKSFNILGLIGVMIAVFSFLLGDVIYSVEFLGIKILGVSILFGSMIILLSIVIPKKAIPAIIPKKYYEKLINNEKVANLTKSYVQLTTRFESRNNRKAKKLRCGMIVMLIGLTISFLGVLLSLM